MPGQGETPGQGQTPGARQPQPGTTPSDPGPRQQQPEPPAVGHPSPGFGPAHPPQGYAQAPAPGSAARGPGQGYPPQGSGQGYPPQGHSQGYPPQGHSQGYPPQGHRQGYPPQGSGQGYPPEGYSQVPAPGYGQAAPVPGGVHGAVAAPPRRTVWPWLVAGGAVVVIALIAAFTIPPLLATPGLPVAATPDVSVLPADPSPTSARSEPAEPPTPQEPEPTPTADDLAGVLAERDAFFAAQQQPMDGSELTPKTPEQKQFIGDQTAWVEQNGGAVTSQAVSIWLALAIDGCETAILNAHNVDSSIFAMHVSTSPLISTLVAQSENPDAEPNLAQTMVFGMGYICPSDGAQWSQLWDEAYG